MMIIIDAGHGGKDPGASWHGMNEKDWTLEISLYQYRRFKEIGIPVMLTRSDDRTVDSGPRSQFVKRSGADYCLCNHINAGGGTGCEAIYSIFSQDKLAKEIARAINTCGMPVHRVYSRQGSDGRDYYYMHRLTGRVETIIVEYGFIDHPIDFSKLRHPSYRLELAEAVVRVMCQWLGVEYNMGKADPRQDGNPAIVKK